MMTLFEWNDNKAKVNLRKHRISFDEAQTVFLDDFSIIIEDSEHSDDEERFIIIGMSYKKRLLVVVYTERGEIIRLISARKATSMEHKKYETDIY